MIYIFRAKNRIYLIKKTYSDLNNMTEKFRFIKRWIFK